MAEQEWLLMVKVRADKEDVNETGRVFVTANEGLETGFFNPSRLIDPADLEYRCPNRGDIFFNLNGDWIEAGGDYAARCLVLHKPKPDKLQKLINNCPLDWSLEMKKKFAIWILEAVEIGKEKKL